jgi:hypothetical protein
LFYVFFFISGLWFCFFCFVGCFSGDELLLFMFRQFLFLTSGRVVFSIVDSVGGDADLWHSNGGLDSVVMVRGCCGGQVVVMSFFYPWIEGYGFGAGAVLMVWWW